MNDWVPLFAVALGSVIATVPTPIAEWLRRRSQRLEQQRTSQRDALIELQGVMEELVIRSLPTTHRDDYTRARLRVHTLVARIDDDEVRGLVGEMLERSAKAATAGTKVHQLYEEVQESFEAAMVPIGVALRRSY
ncbi:MAG: hypothetical protein ACRDJS_02880 [Actinomycetota bacterium]